MKAAIWIMAIIIVLIAGFVIWKQNQIINNKPKPKMAEQVIPPRTIPLVSSETPIEEPVTTGSRIITLNGRRYIV